MAKPGIDRQKASSLKSNTTTFSYFLFTSFGTIESSLTEATAHQS